ncbi:hypothetical protein FQR65_LT03121 [Abscondita terminalis]|nr:hypothetical protein FQR65_LT03121 [Abscondita terminalis]
MHNDMETQDESAMNSHPDLFGSVIYSILTPGICFVGVAGNFVCFVVLFKMNTKCSFYVYLSAIAVIDFFSCITIFLSALARGAWDGRSIWVNLDGMIFLPVGEFLHCLSACATVLVIVDRVIYLKNTVQTTKPSFCRRENALKMLLLVTLFCLVFITPYGFVYELDEDGTIYRTDFYESIYFAIYNWLDIALFAITPVIILCIGNTLLLISIKKACKTLKECQRRLSKKNNRILLDQTKLTITLVAIVIFYLIGEVPTRFTKKTSSPNIFFGGDEEKAEKSMMLQYSRQLTTLLNAFHLAIKFILYAFFCPPFYRSIRKAICHYSKKPIQLKSISINVFFIEDYVLKSMERCYNVDYSKLRVLPEFFTIADTKKLPILL